MRKVTKKWTTKDGSKIRICDMSDKHLLNTIRFIRRVAKASRQYVLSSYPNFDPDTVAFDQAEQGWDNVAQMDLDEYIETEPYAGMYSALCQEAIRRELEHD